MRLTGRLVPAVVSVVGLVFAAGCDAPESSQPTALSSSASQAVAPEVAQPLDAQAFLARPCDLLTAGQLTSLKIQPRGGKPAAGTDKPGTICTWIDDETNNVLNAQWLVSYRDGLDDLYRDRDKQAYFEETKVADYPAVLTGVKDQRSIGECDLELGASAHDVLRVGFAVPLHPESDSCALAMNAAAAMVDTLKGG